MKVIKDVMDPARAGSLHLTLDLDGDPPSSGDELPPFFHQIYFWDVLRPEQLGEDGHPARGIGLVPDLGLPQRMWASGSVEFSAPLRAGIAAEKHSRLGDITHKSGKSGPLAFVTLEHEYFQGGQLCIREIQNLVYKKFSKHRPDPKSARTDARVSRKFSHDEVDLLRYSALTFNGHRIHYDAVHTRDIEGYPGLIVHGPLMAQHMMLLACDGAQLSGFSYRAVSPLFVREEAGLFQNGTDFWVTGSDGRLCMIGKATFS